MKRLFAIAALLLSTVLISAAQKTPPVVSIGSERPVRARQSDGATLLPNVFAGWQISTTPQISKDPAAADATNAPALKEYGLTDFESATYTRPGGRKLEAKAIRFKDASGAYGAYTFYKVPEMLNEKIGDQGSSLNEIVLFYRGNVLVRAVLDKVTAMSAAELRELADDLPQAKGPGANLPTLPTYLPKQTYVANTAKYVVGPAGLAGARAPISADLVDFSRDAEAVLGDYNTEYGTARLMILAYPTPQIAADRLRAIEASRAAGNPSVAPIMAKRTGPLVALVTGRFSESEGKSLLASVNYDAEVTWNQQTHLSKKDNIGDLIINNFLLIAIIFGMAIVLGVAFGGFRLLMKRLFPDRVFDRDIDIIRLNLR